MLSFLAFIFVLGILIIVHEFGHFLAAKKVGVRIEQFCIGFGPKLWKRKSQDTEYSVAAIPLGGFVKLAGDNQEEYKGGSDEYFSKPPSSRALIIFMGPLLNYILGFLCFWFLFTIGYPAPTTKVGTLLDGYGAKAAGVKVGDRIVAVDGKKVSLFEDIQKAIQTRKDAQLVQLSVVRAGQQLIFDIAIKTRAFDDELGRKRTVGLIGIAPSDEITTVRHGVLVSMVKAGEKTWGVTALTYQAFWRIITGRLSIRDSVTGPLGIFYITSQATQAGAIALVYLIAVLSASLAIFNLLPLPVLDGGHILFLIIEKIRGKALSLKAELVITRVGIFALIGLAIFVTYNDIIRFFGDKIAKFMR